MSTRDVVPAARPGAEDRLKIMIVAGEPSGDILGAELARKLKEVTGRRVDLFGMGGPLMAAEDIRLDYGIDVTSIMGLIEVFPKIPGVLKRVREVADLAIAEQPHAVVLIDAPDFTHRVARRLAKRAPELTVIKYVAPQVWASRPGRAKKLAEMTDHVLTLLPFEPAWFESEGLPAHFVGHPVVERQVAKGEGPAFRARHAIPSEAPLLVVLPGSRSNEIRFLLPVYKRVVALLAQRLPDLHCAIPVVEHVREKVEAGVADWPVPLHLVGQDEKFPCFDAGTAALATSGTVTTELGLAGLPMIVAYRVGALTAAIFRHLIRVPHITLLNLIAGERIIPEFTQWFSDAELAEAVYTLLSDADARADQSRRIEAALETMGKGGDSPSERAARAVVRAIAQGTSQTKLLRGPKSLF